MTEPPSATVLSDGSWLGHVENGAGLAASLLAVAAVTVALGIAARSSVWWFAVRRAWELRPAVPPYPSTWLGHWRRARALFRTADPTAMVELDWLCSMLDITYGRVSDRPLAFRPDIGPEQLEDLAVAYENQAARLARRVLSNANSVPAVAGVRDLASNTAELCRQLAVGRSSVHKPDGTYEIRSRGVRLRPLALPIRQPHGAAYDLVVSYRRHLTAPARPGAPWSDMELTAPINVIQLGADLDALQERFEPNRDAFDGVLPRLVDVRIEDDPGSGRRRLHVGLAATTYSAVVADHYCGESQVSRLTPVGAASKRARGVRTVDVDGRHAKLLTLSALPVTSDGYLLFVERSRLVGSHEEMFQSAVNGNLELRDRAGVGVDLNAYGLPDPLAALRREGREELGLDMPLASIYCSGLVQFDSTTERGSYLLLATALVPARFDDVATGTWASDLIEGRWEVGPRLLGIPAPSDEQSALAVAQWLWTDPALTPHATAAGLAAMASLGPCPDWNDLDETQEPRLPPGYRVARIASAGW